MTEVYYKLPPDLEKDIGDFEKDVSRFLAGDLSAAIFRAKRVPRGIYEQREDGTYMMRVRIAGGTLSAAQARELAGLGNTFGNGQLHVTTRQDIQLHDVKIANAPEVMRRLFAVGLTCKGGGGNTVRNVTACPYAGICRSEVFDVTPAAHAVTEYLVALVGSYNLPRKYKIAFSGCAADCACSRVNDLGFVAKQRDGAPGFAVYAGGGMGAQSRVGDLMEDWIPAADAVRTAEAVRRLFDRLGDRANRHRARLRFVFEKIGATAFQKALREEFRIVAAEGTPAFDRALTTLDSPAQPETPREERSADGLRFIAQRQKERVAVVVPLPLGFVSWRDLLKLADIAERFSEEKDLRTTENQAFLIRHAPRAALPAVADSLRGLECMTAANSPLERFVACAGAATCRLGLCLSRNAARACADALSEADLRVETLDRLQVFISGCPNACGRHPIAPIGFSGAAQRNGERLVPSYRITLGARNAEADARLGECVGTIPAKALPDYLVDLARDFQKERCGEESFSAYYDRKSAKHFAALADRHGRVPSYSENAGFYRDFGQEEDFSLAGRGAGECGAGVFEVVRDDIETARKALAAATATSDKQALFDALLAAVRALLITRGVDTAEPDAVLRAFEKHFVDADLVSADYRGLLSRARGYVEGWTAALDGRREEIGRLLDRVELLFSTLDASLAFHPPETRDRPDTAARRVQAAPPAGDAVSANLDLRGVACPMNFVKAKLRLETMEIGESLGIVLDDGEPVQNVPASFRNEGQEVLRTARRDDGRWEVVIKKKS